MARIRSLKPEFRTSLTVTSWPRDVRLFFALLWGYLDDAGRGVDEPRLIKADCFPLDDDITAATVDEWLDLMAKSETVVRYMADGRRYLCIPGWSEHQKTQHPKASRIPAHDAEKIAPDDFKIPESPTESLMRDSGEAHESLNPEQGAGSREMEQGDGANPSSPAADATADQEPPEDPKPDRNAREDVASLCALLADLMVQNGCKRPPVNKTWLDNARLMIDADGRDPEAAARLIRWSQADPFWRTNIQSMPTFRAKYDQLRLKANEEWERRHRTARGSTSNSDAVTDLLARAAAMKNASQLAIGGS